MGKNEEDRQVRKFGKDFDACLSRNEENGPTRLTGMDTAAEVRVMVKESLTVTLTSGLTEKYLRAC